MVVLRTIFFLQKKSKTSPKINILVLKGEVLQTLVKSLTDKKQYMIRIFTTLFTALLGLLPYSIWAQVAAPAKAQSQAIVITNVAIHVGDGQVIEKGLVAFDKGKITLVGAMGSTEIDMTQYEVVDATGKHLYPGLILPNSTIGLEEISAVSATNDNREIGGFNPNVRSLVAYNTDSEIIPTLRFNGVLLAQPTPVGGLVSGTSSVVQLDAWNWEDAAYRADDGIHLNWPSKFMRPRWWLGETEMKENPKYDETVEVLKSTFAEAMAYAAQKPEKTNLKLEAMTGLFNGTKQLYIHTDKAKEIIESCRFAKKQGVKNIVIVGGEDAMLAQDFLKEAKIPVILSSVHRLPNRDEEGVNYPYELPAMLQKAGIEFCLGYTGDMISTTRNLPFYAGTAIAHGLAPEDALKAVTSNTAKILGISDRTGMIKVGLDANVIVSEGDLFDMRTNIITHAFIQGRNASLDNKQQELYEKYREKYGQEK